MDLSPDSVLSLGLGLGLAAACGFRVFVPLLVLSLAARGGYVPLSPGWDWLASNGALLMLASATVIEVVAYYVPWLDHALDTIATPAAMIAGMITSASVLGDLPPLLKWTAVVIGGGGAAALVQGSTVALRAGSGATTAGLANPAVATLELVGSTAVSIIAIALPLLAIVLVVLFFYVVYRLTRRLVRWRRGAAV